MKVPLANQRRVDFRRNGSRFELAVKAFAAFCIAAVLIAPAAAQTPEVGSTAPDFTLSTPTGTSVQLSKETATSGRTVLILLRGFPGYQCPYCVRQVEDFIQHASDFESKKAHILLVYPGPPADLNQHAKEFIAKQAEMPANMKLVIDPDYKMTNLYGLRWDAPHETAYPSTFILDKHRKILFEKVSHEHGDRTTSQDVLAHLEATTPAAP